MLPHLTDHLAVLLVVTKSVLRPVTRPDRLLLGLPGLVDRVQALQTWPRLMSGRHPPAPARAHPVPLPMLPQHAVRLLSLDDSQLLDLIVELLYQRKVKS